MYVVGFYSPKRKSGVTEMSLSVARYLRDEKDLSVAFVSNGTLINEPLNGHTIDRFAALPTRKQKQIMKNLKNEHDLVIYDLSTPEFSEQILELLPLADRVFILHNDDMRFQELLFSILKFNRQFNQKTKDMVAHIHNDGHYILPREEPIGFITNSDSNIKSTGEIIYKHLQIFKLHVYYVSHYNKIKKKLLNAPSDLPIVKLVQDVGFKFEKAILFELFVVVRQLHGQIYANIVNELFPLFIEHDFQTLLRQFEQEKSLLAIRNKFSED